MKHSTLKSLLKKQIPNGPLNGEVIFLNIQMTALLSGGARPGSLVSTCDVKTGDCGDLTSCGTYTECQGKCGVNIIL